MRERQTDSFDRETDRQTDRQTDSYERETDRQTAMRDRQTGSILSEHTNPNPV